MSNFKICLATGVAMGAMVSFNPAMAQSTGTAEAGATDENTIIVTARRKDEQLQDVPASITVFTAEAIEQTGVKVATDFVELTPGVNIVAGSSEVGDTQISIRGLNGARDAENNVALVVDGILKTNVAALNQNQGALNQIEVLKGPQGAIYGRNASAGAIVITTKKPADFFEASGKVSYGNNETWNASAVVSGPIGEGIGFLLSGEYGRSDGFFRNTFLPTALNSQVYPGNTTESAVMDNYERFDINGRLLFEIGSSTEVDLKGRYGEVDAGAIVFNGGFQIPGLFDISRTVSSNIDVNDHISRFDGNVAPNNSQKTIEASARFESDFGSVSLNGYVAYSKIDNSFYADGTSGSFGFFAADAQCIATAAATAGVQIQEPFQTVGAFRSSQPYSPSTCDGTQFQVRDQEDISAELRLASISDGPLSWQLGAYFLHIDRRVCVNLGLDTGQGVVEECYTEDTRNPTEALADDSFSTNVYAAFAAADYEVAEGLTFGVALRYDIEDRKVENNVPTGRRTRWVGNVLTGNPNGTATTPANYYLNPGLDPVYNPSGVLAPRSATFKQLQPKITLTYEPSPDLTLFANWGIGFKSGGFNASGSQVIVDGFFNTGTALFVPGNPINANITLGDLYDKEKTSSFEAGLKGTALNGRLRYELAGYYTDVTDMQFFEFFVGPFGLLRLVTNIDSVEIYGAEFAANVEVVDGWTIFGSGNLLESEIKANSTRPNTVGNSAPYTSDWTINLGTQIEAPISDRMTLNFRADYRITGPTQFHTVQNNTVPNFFFGEGVNEGNFTNSERDPFGILNVRAALTADNWSIAFFGNNILDRKWLTEVIPAPEFGGDFVSPGVGASYGVEVGFKF